MHDIRLIRDDPQAFDAALAKRGVEPVAESLIARDARRREVTTRMQEAQSRRNEASKAIGQAMAQGDKDRAEALKAEVAELKQTLPALEDEDRALAAELQNALAGLPNLPADDVPPGEDESANVEIAQWGERREFAFEPREHADLGPALGMDFETGASISGARFTLLRGQMARLHRALGQFMLDRQTTENGYTECAPPLLVREESLFGTGQLPKFAEDNFQTTDGRWLIPTAVEIIDQPVAVPPVDHHHDEHETERRADADAEIGPDRNLERAPQGLEARTARRPPAAFPRPGAPRLAHRAPRPGSLLAGSTSRQSLQISKWSSVRVATPASPVSPIRSPVLTISPFATVIFARWP